MNLVALTGRLAPVPGRRPHAPSGWSRAAIDVPRREPSDPGILRVALSFPPEITRLVSEELRHGDYVAVVGVLDIEAPTPSAPRPRAFVVVVESIETLDQRAF